MKGYPRDARVFDYLLAHGRYKISVYATYGSHWAFCFVPTAQTELKAALHTRPRIGHDFNNLKYVSLYTEMSRVIIFQISEAYCALDRQVFAAINRRANGNEVFVSRLGTQGLQRYARN